MREEPKDRVMLRAEMPTRLDAAQQPPQQDGESGWRSRVVSARLIVSYTGLDVVENLQVRTAGLTSRSIQACVPLAYMRPLTQS
eukprot:SAG11_NODE_187_length_13061_cov_10.715322_13_plen_84_part_00